MIDDKKKKEKGYVPPELEIITFSDEDIITLSSGNLLAWGEGNEEDF